MFVLEGDETADQEGTDGPGGLAVLSGQELGAKSNGEFFGLYPYPAGDEVVAELVDEDDGTEDQQSDENSHGSSR